MARQPCHGRLTGMPQGRIAKLAAVWRVRPEERAPVAWAFLYFFCLLASYYVLRPVRDAMGIAGKVQELPKLFLVTLAVTFVVTPLFTALVSRWSRRRFVPIANRFFAAQLLVFAWLLHAPNAGAATARVFFVWTSVFNLFSVTIFWAFMADVFRREQGVRLFGLIGAGGTLGAMAGSAVTALLSARLGASALLVIAAVLLEVTVHCVSRLGALFATPTEDAAGRDAELGRGGVVAWARAAAASPYLVAIVGYMLLFSFTSTFVYFEQARIVKAALPTTALRTELFAKMDLAVNLGSLLLQGVLVAPLLRVVGVGAVLVVLPALTLAGCVALGVHPTLTAVVVFQVARRACDYGIAKPAREVLFTVVTREEKYKAKAFIDTFVYRTGDALGAAVFGGAAALGPMVLVVSVPACLVWMGVSFALGRLRPPVTASP